MHRLCRLTCFLLLLMPALLPAQCKDNMYEILDVNQVMTRFNNSADAHWDMRGLPIYEVPKGSGKHSCFARGLWIGGLDPAGELHMSASNYRQSGWEWYAGPFKQPTAYDCAPTLAASSDLQLHPFTRLSNGKLLILTENQALIYDMVTRAVITRPLPTTRTFLEAVELPDGRIFLYGDDAYPTKNPALFMDTVNYNITGGPTLQWFHRESSAHVLRSGKVLIAGVVGCELFDPATNMSAAVPDMLYPRTRHGSAMLPNGDIFFVGGSPSINGGSLTLTTQRYDDTLGYWFAGPSLQAGRNRATIVTLPDGRLLICGGSMFSAITEIYDPMLDTLYASFALPMKVSTCVASVVPGDRVVISAEENGNQPGLLFSYNYLTGESEFVKMQLCGHRSILVDSTTLLVEVGSIDRELQIVNIETGAQDDDRWQFVWKLTRAEIDEFRADFATGNVDFSKYPNIESWPAHGDEAGGEDRNLAPFIDVNGDGLYRPATQGDYPCIVGDMGLWWVFNDNGPHGQSGGKRLGIQVEAMAYGVDCNLTPCPDTTLDYTTFVHYEFTNHSDTAYHDVYLGNLLDVDLGGFEDDYVGSDSVLGLAFGYNGDNSDAVYGAAPPAIANMIIPNGQVDSMYAFMYYENDFSVKGNPVLPGEFYNYLRAQYKDSTHLVNNGLDGYAGTATGPMTRFMYSSTDSFCSGNYGGGWNEFTAGNMPFDRRVLQSSGPFDLAPGERLRWDMALLWNRTDNHLKAVCNLKAAAVNVRDWWQNTLDHGCFDIVVGREEPLAQPQGLTVYPNPAGGERVRVRWPEGMTDEGGTLEVVDLQGRNVWHQALEGGADEVEVAVDDLPAGLYFVQLRTLRGSLVQRMVVN